MKKKCNIYKEKKQKKKRSIALGMLKHSFSVSCLILIVEASAKHSIRAHLTICNCYVGRMCGIALQCLRTLKNAIEHYIGI